MKKKFYVVGYAFVPHRFAATVTARSEADAINKAKRLFKKNKRNFHRGGEDIAAAFDWEPGADELLTPETNR